jgi:hypothetical protein
MRDSLLHRWLLALGAAVVISLLITASISRATRRTEKSDDQAVAVWKARTGVDLAALPGLHPPNPDSDEARALDALVQPLDLQLGDRKRGQHPDVRDAEALDGLRDALRAAIRSETTEAKPLPPAVVAAIERRAPTLDAVADYVAAHEGIRWREDFEPRAGRSTIYTNDHLLLHRLLIGRAFLALERGDTKTSARMLSTSQRLNRVLEERQELWSQFVAVGVERMHLALLRRARGTLTATPAAPAEGIRERYLAAMSAEAAVALANAGQDAINSDDNDPGVAIVRVLAGPKLELAASEAVRIAAEAVAEIVRSPDGCAELARKRRRPTGFFAGEFFALDATDAWRRFVVLELDRAITAAVLSGKAASPCPSVTLSVRDEGSTRTVTAKGLPAETDSVVSLPAVVTTRR